MKRGLVCAAAFALAAAACEPADKTAVIDGEHVIVKGHKITLHQLDAPDAKNGKCEAERSLGQQTEARLAALFGGARDVEFQKTGMACLQLMDCDGFVKVDGADVGETLIAEGLAVKDIVEGADMTPHDWCAAPPPAAPASEPAPPEQTTAPAEPPPQQAAPT